MKKWFLWLLAWVRLRASSVALAHAESARYALERALVRLVKKEKKLEKLQKRLSVLADQIDDDVRRTKMLVEQSERALTEVRQECQVYRDVTIPTLVQQSRVLLARYDAEVAVEVRRRTAAQETNTDRV